jgi:hypothetical protein
VKHRRFDPATYRSPLEDNPAFSASRVGGWVLYAIRGGVAALMPPLPASASRRWRGLYLARRDANLMGLCPSCGARAPLLRRVTTRVDMRHARACPVADAVYGARVIDAGGSA